MLKEEEEVEQETILNDKETIQLTSLNQDQNKGFISSGIFQKILSFFFFL